MKNTRFLLSAAAAVTVAAILLSGCSTPEETMSESSQPQAPSYRYEHELNVIDEMCIRDRHHTAQMAGFVQP